MSADKWTVCPRCSDRADKAHADAVRTASESYGKVGMSEFMALTERAKADKWTLLPGDGDSETLREDYEVGINEDGEFCLSYTASCQSKDCTFKYERRIRERVEV